MNDKQRKALGFNLGNSEKIFDMPANKVADRYISDSNFETYTEASFKKDFFDELNRIDKKTKRRIYPNLVLTEGINLNYFWNVFLQEIYPIIPDRTTLNFNMIFKDVEEILANNKREVGLMRTLRENRTPTAFMLKLTELVAIKWVTDKAIAEAVKNPDIYGSSEGTGESV